MLDASLIASPEGSPAATGFMVYPAASRHAVFWMLDWAASFDLCSDFNIVSASKPRRATSLSAASAGLLYIEYTEGIRSVFKDLCEK
jgi:hypothetical protein